MPTSYKNGYNGFQSDKVSDQRNLGTYVGFYKETTEFSEIQGYKRLSR